MQDSNVLDELDLEIVNALQLAPRARWADLAPILGADPTTLARRWQRLTDDGIARITVVPRRGTVSQQSVAYVELRCANGAIPKVTARLAADPDVLTIHHTAGFAQLMIVLTAGPRLPDYLLNRIGPISGVLDYAVHIITDLPFETDRWHIRALTADQHNRLRALGVGAGDGRSLEGRVTDLDRELVTRLCVDGRASYQELADQTGVSAPAVARRLNRLLRARVIGLRCDVSRRRLGLPGAVFLRGTLDRAEFRTAMGELGARIPELRLITAVAGASNSQLSVWLRSIADLFQVEERLARELPSLRVTDRIVVLRTIKLMGHILDDSERRIRTVPINVDYL
ncbi:Lrp/AsnC family transcriptional regulator [Phytoactinopolyspora mesophila]|uniref:AsnC family transcriptional regulator n=1 Tax=Phytoactinopolyspora mesophila TaxID=2650750 RepID=A0A7K3M3P7_9ACTN|nr:Lrp/AsnC family transcriptional regulator [Phytoactinopolyspora mesophila]NDL57865.1 AsnC family transcriptional regulator [Phytoactinopolyspora mesophila]